MRVMFVSIAELCDARLLAWEKGMDPEYPPSKGLGSIGAAEREDSIRVSGVMAPSGDAAVQLVLNKLRRSSGMRRLCEPRLNSVRSKRGGNKWTVFVNAYGPESATICRDLLDGRPLATSGVKPAPKDVVKVYWDDDPSACRLCTRKGHSAKKCEAPHIRLDHMGGLNNNFCGILRDILGAATVTAGVDPHHDRDCCFGYAIFDSIEAWGKGVAAWPAFLQAGYLTGPPIARRRAVIKV